MIFNKKKKWNTNIGQNKRSKNMILFFNKKINGIYDKNIQKADNNNKKST